MFWPQSSPGSAPGGLELPWALGALVQVVPLKLAAFQSGRLLCLLSQKPSLRAPASDWGLGASSGCSTLGCWGCPISLQGLACRQLTHPNQRAQGGADQPARVHSGLYLSCSPGHPGLAFDLGDVIHYDGGVAYEDDCCIMAYNYVFGKDYTAKGFGDNPALATARSKADKELSGLKSRTRSNVVEMRTFVNASEIYLEDDVEQTIISLDFTTVDDTNVSIFHEIQLDCDSEDMSVEVTYHLDDAELTYHPVENWKTDGKHILSLMYFITVLGGYAYTWTVTLKVTGGNALIGRDNARASLSGQGLAAVSKWAGKIDIKEDIGIIQLPLQKTELMAMAESVLADTKEYYVSSIAQNIGLISMDGTPVALMGMHEDMWFLEPLSELTWGEASAFTWEQLNEEYCWGNEYPS